MATKHLTGAPSRTDHDRPTAPLPPAAVAALSRLELRLDGRTPADVAAHELASYVRPSAAVDRAVTRFEIAAATVDRLSRLDARDLSPAQFDLLDEAQRELDTLRSQLAAAGALHRVELS